MCLFAGGPDIGAWPVAALPKSRGFFLSNRYGPRVLTDHVDHSENVSRGIVLIANRLNIGQISLPLSINTAGIDRVTLKVAPSGSVESVFVLTGQKFGHFITRHIDYVGRLFSLIEPLGSAVRARSGGIVVKYR